MNRNNLISLVLLRFYVGMAWASFEIAFAAFGIDRLEFWRLIAGLAALSVARRMAWDALGVWVDRNG